MEEKQFEIYDNTNRLASNMSLNTALIFIKAYCYEYYNENVNLTLVEMKGESSDGRQVFMPCKEN